MERIKEDKSCVGEVPFEGIKGQTYTAEQKTKNVLKLLKEKATTA